MKRKLFLTAVSLLVTLAFAATAYGLWHASAVPMPGWTVSSPDGRYRIEYHRVWTPHHLLPTSPGNGSDNIDGFIRLYRADGTLLHETYRSVLRDYQAFWNEDSVSFLGPDGPSWNLPQRGPTSRRDALQRAP